MTSHWPDPARGPAIARISRSSSWLGMERYGSQAGMGGGYAGYGGVSGNPGQAPAGGGYNDGSANMQLQQLLLQQLQGTTPQAGMSGSILGNPTDPYAVDRQAPYDPYAASGTAYSCLLHRADRNESITSYFKETYHFIKAELNYFTPRFSHFHFFCIFPCAALISLSLPRKSPCAESRTWPRAGFLEWLATSGP
jgi:hypothetical protein